MSEKVFVSYAAEDHGFVEDLKQRLAELLKAAELLKTETPLHLIDPHTALEAGADLRKAVKADVDAANTVVIVSSPASDASQWVNYEAGLADALGKQMVIIGREGSENTLLSQRFAGRATFLKAPMRS